MTGIYVMAAGTIILIAIFMLWCSGKYLTAKQDKITDRIGFFGSIMVIVGSSMAFNQYGIFKGWWT